jgi:hypothetical protein
LWNGIQSCRRITRDAISYQNTFRSIFPLSSGTEKRRFVISSAVSENVRIRKAKM